MTTLNELKQLCAAATLGPWKVSNYRPHFVIARDPKESTYTEVDDSFTPLFDCKTVDDGKFIACARNNLPKLIELIELMRDAMRFYSSEEIYCIPVMVVDSNGREVLSPASYKNCFIDRGKKAKHALSALERFEQGE